MDEYQLEDGSGGYQLEDGSGNYLLEGGLVEDPMPILGGGYYPEQG